jgi:hypothetical protein
MEVLGGSVELLNTYTLPSLFLIAGLFHLLIVVKHGEFNENQL